MPTYTRARSSRQRRHSASRSKTHAQDKANGEKRRGLVFVAVPAPQRPSPKRTLSAFLTGHEYIHSADRWTRCQGKEEYADYLDAEAERRAWFIGKTKRKGIEGTMKRPAATPVEIVTVTFSPWLSDFLAAAFEAGRDPRPQLAKIRTRFIQAAGGHLNGKRHFLGYAYHADTDDHHFDLALSRQDGRGGRIGKAGLLMVGPWCVGVDRQLRSGATISADKKQKLKSSAENFRHRYGAKAVPLDVQLARDFDAICADVIGPDLAPWMNRYAQGVPALEKAHAAAALQVIRAAEEKISPKAAPQPEPGRDRTPAIEHGPDLSPSM